MCTAYGSRLTAAAAAAAEQLSSWDLGCVERVTTTETLIRVFCEADKD